VLQLRQLSVCWSEGIDVIIIIIIRGGGSGDGGGSCCGGDGGGGCYGWCISNVMELNTNTPSYFLLK
jgi:hypothetical protein